MRNLIRRSMVVGIISLTLLVSGCYIDFGSSGGGSKTATVTELAWTYSNVSQNYWSGTAPTPEVFLSFALKLQETNLLQSDFSRAIFAARGESWTVDSSGLSYDASTSVLSVSSLGLDSSPYALPLTGWSVTVELVNGLSSTRTFDLYPPGTSQPDSTKTHVYNDSYPDTPPSGYVEVVDQPNVTRDDRNATSVFVDFNVSDSNVYNGWVEFFDASDTYVGRSKFFKDWENNDVDETVIPSGTLNIGGGTNSTSIESADVVLEGGATFASIAKVVVVVTDGAQYLSQGAYNYQGLSARKDMSDPND